ncbi:MAG TPA: chemotaxis protein CheW [Polyangiaceae bacterium]
MKRSKLTEGDASVLRCRAEALARPLTLDRDQVVLSFVVVRLGAERIGLPIESLWGAFYNVKLTPVPQAPRWLAGLAQVRGELISVAQLGHWFDAPYVAESGALAVLEGPRGLLGVLVDEVLGFVDFRQDQLSHELAATLGSTGRPIAAVSSDLVSILDAKRFLEDPRLIVDDRAEV